MIKSSRSVNCNTPLKCDAIIAAVKRLLFVFSVVKMRRWVALILLFKCLDLLISF